MDVDVDTAAIIIRVTGTKYQPRGGQKEEEEEEEAGDARIRG